MKNGKDSRQNQEFLASLVRCAPRLDSETQQLLIDNPKEFAHILRRMMIPNIKEPLGLKLFYPITVDRNSPWEKDILEANLEYSTNSFGFFLTDFGPARTSIFLLPFDVETEYKKILQEIDLMDFRPADLKEIVALSIKYPKLQNNVEIGTLYNDHLSACLKYDFSRNKKLLCLYDNNDERLTPSFRDIIRSDKIWRFAVVLK